MSSPRNVTESTASIVEMLKHTGDLENALIENEEKSSASEELARPPSYQARSSYDCKISTKGGAMCGGAGLVFGGAAGYLTCGLYGLAAAAVSMPAAWFGCYLFELCDETSDHADVEPSQCVGFAARR